MRLTGFVAPWLALVCLAREAPGQIARKDYYAQVPPAPRIGSETRASARLSLFGDRAREDYRDASPLNGIDDRRDERLIQIAERFSPILRRNNFSVPRNFRTVEGMRLVIHADDWVDGTLSRADSVDLSDVAGAPADGSNPDSGLAVRDDAKLLALLRQFDPRRSEPAFREPGPQRETILYLDFPGENEKTWRRAYSRHDPRVSTIYAHPFIDEQESGGERRFTLVMQFWFFYPFNDAANNHEADWEHINVAITTLARVAEDRSSPGPRGLLTEEDVRRMTDVERAIPLDSLTIRSASYYFHHSVVVLDYLSPPPPRNDPPSWLTGRPKPPIWEDADFFTSALRARLRVAGGRLSTHPFGYIGGNSRGPYELLTTVPRFHRSYNRDSHATYPFPGTWRGTGLAGATEQVFGEIEPRVRRKPRAGTDSIPWFDLLEEEHYVTYRRSSIVLVPDWERIIDGAAVDPRVRRDWAWLILPLHFGYPATISLGGGAIERTNLGNVSPINPAYNPAWNQPTISSEHHLLNPHVLRVAFAPVSPFTGLQNGWGVLNIPIAVAGIVPGIQVATAQVLPWISGTLGVLGAPPAKTFYAGRLPSRFTSFAAGRFTRFGGDGFGRLLPREEDDSIAAVLQRGADRGAQIDHLSYRRHSSSGNRLWLLLHYGDRYSIENTIAIDTTALRYDIRDRDGASLSRVDGRIAMREISGGVRYAGRLFRDEIRGYVRAGYLWTWYTVYDVTIDGRPVATSRTRGGHIPSLVPSTSWWPNSMYGGGGVELFAPRRAWILHRLGYGVAAELTTVAYPLRTHRCSCVLERGDRAVAVVFGW